MNKLVFIISLLVFLESCTQNPVIPKSDLKVASIGGPVSQITEINYWTRKVGNVIKVGDGSQKTISDYNETGNVVCKRFYQNGDELSDSTIYSYDIYNRLVKSTRFEKSTKIEDKYYFWDRRNVIIILRNKYIGEMKYDNEGNLTYIKTSRNDDRFEISKVKYDKYGRVIESSENYQGKTAYSKITYKKSGNYESDFISRSGETVHYFHKLFFDKYHNIIFTVPIDNKGNVGGAMKYLIKYRE